jgi:hypothetical protein
MSISMLQAESRAKAVSNQQETEVNTSSTFPALKKVVTFSHRQQNENVISI